jgi:hypothetical protein
MTSSIFSTSSALPRVGREAFSIRALVFLVVTLCFAPLIAFAQTSAAQSNVLSVVPGATLTAKAGTLATAALTLRLLSGYHCNSDKPKDEYLIPLKLTWTKLQGDDWELYHGPEPIGHVVPIEGAEVIYPKPQMEKFSFSPEPMPVFTGDFEVVTRFKLPASGRTGQGLVLGKLRYQACNDRMCLQPKTIEVTLPFNITK